MDVIEARKTDLEPQFVGAPQAAGLLRVDLDQLESWLRAREIPFVWEEGNMGSAMIPVQTLLWHAPRLLPSARDGVELLALTGSSHED